MLDTAKPRTPILPEPEPVFWQWQDAAGRAIESWLAARYNYERVVMKIRAIERAAGASLSAETVEHLTREYMTAYDRLNWAASEAHAAARPPSPTPPVPVRPTARPMPTASPPSSVIRPRGTKDDGGAS